MRFTLTHILLFAVSFACLGQSKTSDRLSNSDQVIFTRKYINADKERIQGNYQEAYELYSSCLAMDPKNDGVHYALARLFLTQNNLEQAAYHYSIAHKLAPKNEWYLVQLADVQAQKNDIKSADKTFKKLRALDESNPEYIYNHASLMLYTRNTKKALQYFEDYEKVAGMSPEVSIAKFKYLVGEEKFDLAVNEMEKAIARFPEQAKFYSYLADLYKAQGRYEKALEIFSKAMKVEPNNPYIQLSLAEYFEQNNKADSAKLYLTKAFENASLDIDTKISILLSKYPSAERNPEVRAELIGLCDKLVATHPANPKAHSVTGDFLFLDNQLEGARSSYYKAIEIDPSKFALWSQVLLIDSELNDPSSMLVDSEKALELFPTQPSVYLFNGLANNQKENFQKAAKSLKTGASLVIGNKPLEIQLLASLGDAYHELDKHTLSDSAYNAALRIDSNNTYVLNNFSYFLSLRKDKLEQAKDMSLRAISLNPKNASYLDTHGWVLYQMGDYNGAKTYLELAMEYGGGDSGEVLEHYGDTLFQLGDADGAKEFWRKAKDAGDASELIDQKISTGSIN